MGSSSSVHRREMTEKKKISGAELIAGITRGEVPRQIRLLAAQGLLPISREEMMGLQCILSSDPDQELAKVAAESVQSVEQETILAWLRHNPPESLVLDQLIRVRGDLYDGNPDYYAEHDQHHQAHSETDSQVREQPNHAHPILL